eukprot:Hpha_TRINITY_DN12786_c0_g1::TRINITY_DN12786_c0_g1_i1::g.114665::m.114665
MGDKKPSHHDAAAAAKNQNHYEILGVEKNATEGEITKAYRKLALQLHPDRQWGKTPAEQEQAAEQFKKVAAAYAVVSDPNKRRAYDLHGDTGEGEPEPFDVSQMGTGMRFMAAMLNKMGLPVPTAITPEVLAKAQELASAREDGGTDLVTLKPGLVHHGRLSRQTAVYFRFQSGSAGVVLDCTSRSKGDRFKLVVLDDQGRVRYQQESQNSGSNASRAALYFCPFETVVCPAAPPPLDREIPPEVQNLFSQAEVLQFRPPTVLSEGWHIGVVFADNFVTGVDYGVCVTPADSPSGRLVEVHDGLKEARGRSQTLSEEFQVKYKEFKEAQARLEEVATRCAREGEGLGKLAGQHHAADLEFVADSRRRHGPAVQPAPPSSGGLLSSKLMGLFPGGRK